MKNRLKYISIVTAAAFSLFVGSCRDAGNEAEPEMPGEGIDIRVRLSRADFEPEDNGLRSYRVIFLNLLSSNLSFNGTYISPEVDPATRARDGLLRPWTLDHDDADPFYPAVGNIDDAGGYDIMRGLYSGPNSAFRMLVVSPARMPRSLYVYNKEEDIWEWKWGFQISRCAYRKPAQEISGDYAHGNDGTEPLYISEPFTVNIGSSLADYDGQTLYHELNLYGRYDKVLIEKRASLRLIVDADPTLGSAQISKVGLINHVENAVLYCGTSEYIGESKATTEMTLFEAPAGTYATVTDTDCVKAPDADHSERTDAAGEAYTQLLSKDYSLKDAAGVYLDSGPIALIHLTDENGNDIEARVELQYNFEPQHDYTFHITVRSRYMVVKVTARPWEFDAASSTVFDTPDTAPVAVDIIPWEPNPAADAHF